MPVVVVKSEYADGESLFCSSAIIGQDSKTGKTKCTKSYCSPFCQCKNKKFYNLKKSFWDCKAKGDCFDSKHKSLPLSGPNEAHELVIYDRDGSCMLYIPRPIVASGINAEKILIYLRHRFNLTIPAEANHRNILHFPTLGISWVFKFGQSLKHSSQAPQKSVLRIGFRIWRH